MKIPTPFNLYLLSILFTMSLLLTSCGRGCGRSVDPQPAATAEMPIAESTQQDALDLIPLSSTFVVKIVLQKMIDSPLAGDILNDLPPSLMENLENIQNIVFGFKLSTELQVQDQVGMANGDFDLQAIQNALNQDESRSVESYAGVKIYSHPEEKDLSIVFLKNYFVFGNKDALKKSIDISQGRGDSIRKNEGLMRRIQGYSGGKSFAIFGVWPQALIPQEWTQLFGENPGIQYFDLVLDSGETTLGAKMVFALSSLEATTRLSQQLGAVKEMFKAQLDDKNSAIKKIIDTLNIRTKDQQVEVAFNADNAIFEAFNQEGSEEQENFENPSTNTFGNQTTKTTVAKKSRASSGYNARYMYHLYKAPYQYKPQPLPRSILLIRKNPDRRYYY